jgi:pyruvate dehydrogenase E2 component (dihydrolipoamide acetyltransferase)
LGAAAVVETKEPEKAEPKEGDEEEGAGVVGTMELAGKNAYLAASDEGSSKPKTEEKSISKVLATPLARAMAKDLNIDINAIKGTGPSGRVTKEDIQNHQPAKRAVEVKQKAEPFTPIQPAEAYTYEALSQIRKAIAKNMLNSKQSTAHMTLFEEVEISDLMKIRDKFKHKYAEKGIKLTYLSFIVKATVHALKKHRQLNSQMDMENDRMIFKNYYNIAIAIDTPEGLVVPVIRNADQLSIMQIAHEIMLLSDKARDRKLTMDDMKDGTFTLTNYGSIGGIFATPVINYPQAGILGIGRIVKKPVIKNDQVVAGNVLPLSLSVDHRIVDGGEASRFVNSIMEYLSDPMLLLME